MNDIAIDAQGEDHAERAHKAMNAPNPWVLGTILLALFSWLAMQRDFGQDGYYIPAKGLVLVVLGLAPGLLYFGRVRANKGAVEPLPYIPILGLIYAVYYGMPVLFRDRVSFMSLQPNAAALSESLNQALGGWIALLLGFFLLGPRLLAAHKDRPLRIDWDENRARNLAIVLIAIGAVSTMVSEAFAIPSYLTQVVRLLSMMLQVGLGICIILDLKGKSPPGWRTVLWFIILPAFLFLHLRTGQIGAVVRPFAFVMLLIWACRFRLPWMTIGIVISVAILLRGAAEEFRTAMWRSSAVSSSSAFERSAMYFGIAQRNLMARPGETIESATDLIGSRTAQLALFAHTIHRTPEAVPYWGGETYQTLASSFVPRFIWRDKPTKELGQRFGHRYAVLGSNDYKTAINLPQLVELYINFGPIGVWLGMLGFGVLFAFAYMKLNHPHAGDGTMLIGAIIFSELINIESDFSLVFGGLIQIVVILYFVVRVCESPKSRVIARPVLTPRAFSTQSR